MEQLYGALQIVRFCFVYLVVLATVDIAGLRKNTCQWARSTVINGVRRRGPCYVDVVMTNEQHL